MTKLRLQLRFWLLLWSLFFASGLVPQSAFGNNAYLTASTVYDVASFLVLNYDSPSTLCANESKNRIGEEGGVFARFAQFLAAEGGQNIVYRALTQADADALAAGEGLTAKAPNGTWTAAEHVANAGPGTGGASLNSPWISTSSRLDVAQAYDSGNGVVAIDLNKVPSLQVQVWQTVNGSVPSIIVLAV